MGHPDFLTLLLIALAGMAGGFCSSAPLGAINLWITDAVLDREERHLRWFIIGVVLADMTHAALASWGYHTYLQESGFAAGLGILGGAFLVVLGALGLARRKAPAEGSADKRVRASHRPVQGFLLGAFMCGANPAFLVFWVFAITLVERHLNVLVSGLALAWFLAGLALGDTTWFLLLLAVVRRGREAVTPKALAPVRVAIATVFLVIGSVAIYKGFR